MMNPGDGAVRKNTFLSKFVMKRCQHASLESKRQCESTAGPALIRYFDWGVCQGFNSINTEKAKQEQRKQVDKTLPLPPCRHWLTQKKQDKSGIINNSLINTSFTQRRCFVKSPVLTTNKTDITFSASCKCFWSQMQRKAKAQIREGVCVQQNDENGCFSSAEHAWSAAETCKQSGKISEASLSPHDTSALNTQGTKEPRVRNMIAQYQYLSVCSQTLSRFLLKNLSSKFRSFFQSYLWLNRSKLFFMVVVAHSDWRWLRWEAKGSQ